MIETIEKTLLAGIGALALSQKKTDELLDELKQKMNLSEEEGRALLDKFRSATDEQRDKLGKMAKEEIEKSMKRFGAVTKKEFDALKRKVAKLEKTIKEAGI
ncbi:MAG: phasin superfamily protein [Desulfuromonas sp.]|nr:MAG: phasin superfamily protein [Desulfuromonas sp.]